MFGIKAQITKCIDDNGYPSFVECQFVDTHKNKQVFHDKDVMFTTENLDRNSNYPIDGSIACQIIEREIIEGREIVRIDSKLPWHIESVNGETVFEVLAEQITEFQTKENTTPAFIPFQSNMVSVKYHLQNLYDAFNRREIETILSMMKEDVKWANGMEGGFVYGRDAVREYWRKQFELIDPQLEPLKFETDENGRSVVTVHQTVRDLDGKIILNKTVKQIFTFENGFVKTFEIGNAK